MTTADGTLDDPAEAWALVERYAGAAVPAAHAEARAALEHLLALLPGPRDFPGESANVALLAAFSRAGACLDAYHGACTTTRGMMAAHYRCFPAWEGPWKVGGG